MWKALGDDAASDRKSVVNGRVIGEIRVSCLVAIAFMQLFLVPARTDKTFLSTFLLHALNVMLRLRTTYKQERRKDSSIQSLGWGDG